jgi:hypothetical protein
LRPKCSEKYTRQNTKKLTKNKKGNARKNDKCKTRIHHQNKRTNAGGDFEVLGLLERGKLPNPAGSGIEQGAN